MKLIALGTQVSDVINDVVLWTYDKETNLSVKAHIAEEKLVGISAGDELEVTIKRLCKRQEVWIDNIINVVTKNEEIFNEFLESKAATPFSVTAPDYFGNLVKVGEVVGIEGILVKAKLIGFPKQIHYLFINDAKWSYYCKNNYKGDYSSDEIVTALNSRSNVYCVIDYPMEGQPGVVQVAAMVIV